MSTQQEIKEAKELIRHDLRKDSLTIRSYQEEDFFYNIVIEETSCEYDTKTTQKEYFAEIIDCHRHSEGVNILIKTVNRPLDKETMKSLYLIRVRQSRTWVGKLFGILNQKHEYLLDPYFKSEGRAIDRPGKQDGRYEEFLRILRSREKTQ